MQYSYIIKQNIYIHVAYSRPNGWTNWADIFCGQGVLQAIQKFDIFFFIFFHGQRRTHQLVINKRHVYCIDKIGEEKD